MKGAPRDLLPDVKKHFNAKKLCMFFFFLFTFLKLIIIIDIGRKAAFGIRAVNRMATLAHVEHDGKAQMREDIFKYKEESAKVCCVVNCFMRLMLSFFF